MAILHKPFEIAYCGVRTKITPVVNGLNMQYIISIPTRQVTIEKESDEDKIDYWQEVAGGRTTLAEEIGRIIEGRDM